MVGALVDFPLQQTSPMLTRQVVKKFHQLSGINIVVKNKAVEICDKYLKKGDKVYLEGKIRTRKWQSEDGNQRYSTEIHVTEFNFLNSKNEDQHTAPNETQSFTSNENHENDSDDLPF